MDQHYVVQSLETKFLKNASGFLEMKEDLPKSSSLVFPT